MDQDIQLNLRHLRSVLDVESVYTAFIEEYDSSFDFPGESHDLWEIGAVLSGCAGITSGAEVYECKVGEMIIHAPGVFHTARAKYGAGVRILTVSFRARGGTRYIPSGKFILTAPEQTLLCLLGDLIDARMENPKPIKASLRPSEEQMLKNYLEILCLSLHLRRAQTQSPDKEERAAMFAEAVGFMQAHVDDAISVEDVCMACGIGRTVLKELFRHYTGMGVMQHYNHLRLRRIIERMTEGEALGDIAISMNFSSQSYMTAFFRRQTGVAPRNYLK